MIDERERENDHVKHFVKKEEGMKEWKLWSRTNTCYPFFVSISFQETSRMRTMLFNMFENGELDQVGTCNNELYVLQMQDVYKGIRTHSFSLKKKTGNEGNNYRRKRATAHWHISYGPQTCMTATSGINDLKQRKNAIKSNWEYEAGSWKYRRRRKLTNVIVISVYFRIFPENSIFARKFARMDVKSRVTESDLKSH